MENHNILKIIILIIICMFLIISIPAMIFITDTMEMSGISIDFKMNYIIILVTICFILSWLVYIYNKLTHLKEIVNQAKSGIDIYLQKRFDSIPNLVEIVKVHSNHEKTLLENIIMLRNEYNQRDIKNIKQTENLYNNYTSLLTTVERYPELKSSESYLNLQNTLKKIEDELQAIRRIYNVDVTNYNIQIKKFPNVIVAKIFKFKEEMLFQILDDENKNININIHQE